MIKTNPKFIPGIFTLLNLFLGVMAIIRTVEKDYSMAAWLIIFAVLADGMDGKIARWIDQESRFGFELDSLADSVSFCVAPALLTFYSQIKETGWIAFIPVFMYIFAGVFRLARFNVIQAGDRSEGYVGLPVPIPAMLLASGVFIMDLNLFDPLPIAWFLLMGFLSLLMISTIPYDWPKLAFHGSSIEKIKSTGIILLLFGMILWPAYCLFPVLIGYILFGIVRQLRESAENRWSLVQFFKHQS